MRYNLFAAVVFSFFAGQSLLTAAEPAKTASVPADTVGPQEKIFKALRAPARNFEFFEAPLTEVLNRIKEDHEIQLVLDEKALNDAAIGTDTLITKQLREISLASALNLTLGDHELTWVLRDDVVVITTAKQAEKMLTRRAYPVRDLVPNDGANATDFQELIQIVRETVEPESWRGAPVPMAPAKPGNEEPKPPRGAIVPSTASGSLVVLQRRAVHDEIDALLAALRTARQQQGIESPAPIVPGAVAPKVPMPGKR